MAETDKLSNHLNVLGELKRDFMNASVNDQYALLQKMKLIEGCAILDNYQAIKEVANKTIENTPNNQILQLSTNHSLLYLISNHVRFCEKKLYKQQSNDITFTLKNNEVIIEGIDTDNLPVNNYTGGNHLGVTEYIGDLTTTEANRLDNTETNRSIKSNDLDLTKPTLVYYRMATCSYCQMFDPTWQAFTKTVATQMPNLQTFCLTVNDKNSKTLADKVGVKGFPSIVYFKNKTISEPRIATKMSVDDLLQYVID